MKHRRKMYIIYLVKSNGDEVNRKFFGTIDEAVDEWNRLSRFYETKDGRIYNEKEWNERQ